MASLLMGMFALPVFPSLFQGETAQGQQELMAALSGCWVSFRVAPSQPWAQAVEATIHRFVATDELLERLKGFPELEKLTFIDDCGGVQTGYHPPWRITDAGVAHLKALKRLRSLSVPSPLITDRGMVFLGQMTQLRELEIGSSGGFEMAANPGWKDREVANITDAGLKQLKGLRELTRLKLSGTRITNGGLMGLTEFPQLQHLSIRILADGINEKCLVTVRDLKQLRLLELNDFASGPPIDACLAHLKELPRLESLTVFSLRVTRAGFAPLSELTNVKRLSLNVPIGDEELRPLGRLPRLEKLELGYPARVTPAGVAELRRMLPQIIIDAP
jgi:hypothetical protein